MVDRTAADAQIREHYERVWSAGDAWDFETSAFERDRYDFLVGLIADRRYGRAVEIGCGSGCFTSRLRVLADQVLALDVATAAIERARGQPAVAGAGSAEFVVANAMDHDFAAGGPWDLIVLTETVYSLGWLYSLFDLGMFALHLRESLAAGGRLLLSNTYGAERDWLMRPSLIDTYRDLFVNVGLSIESESVFEGVKDGESFRVLTTLLRAAQPRPPA
jgi:2-polyprenyl-3-methyl-5-hydroxy-6-metoxy-1,4-benzoquinol methylase